MPWSYRLRKRMFNGTPWFDVVEYYVSGKSKGWTQDGMAPGGETRDEVINCLEMMLADVKGSKVLVERAGRRKKKAAA